MKKINYKLIIKSLLVIGLLFSLITPAFAVEGSNSNSNPTNEEIKVKFITNVECPGFPLDVDTQLEEGKLVFTTPSVYSIANLRFTGWKRVYQYGTDNERLGMTAYAQEQSISITGDLSGPFVYMGIFEEVVDNINPSTAQFDKAAPTDLSFLISVVEETYITKLEVDNDFIGSDECTLNELEDMDEGYQSAFNLTLKKEFLNKLALGEHNLVVGYDDDQLLSVKFNISDSSLPKKCTINFAYSPANAGYVEFKNLTTGYYDITDATSIEVNRGDKISFCNYGKPGYFGFSTKRNGEDLYTSCDEIIVEEDLTYEFGYSQYYHGVSLTPTQIDFGKQEVGYGTIAEKEIEFKNDTTESYPVIISKPKNFDMSEIQCEKAVVLPDQIMLFNGSSCKFTVKPKDGLAVGNYEEKIEILDYVNKPEEVEPLSAGARTSYVPIDYEVLGSLSLSFEVGAEKDDIPETSDANQIAMYGTVSVVALATAVYLLKKRHAIK